MLAEMEPLRFIQEWETGTGESILLSLVYKSLFTKRRLISFLLFDSDLYSPVLGPSLRQALAGNVIDV
jgi:hypothetical protein